MSVSIRSSTSEEDPLHAFSGVSLFPRTLKSLSIPLPSLSLNHSEDLQQSHTLLQSMPFEIGKEHQEQGKAILDDSSEILKQGTETTVESQDTNVGVKNPIPNKRERRPGLDRKRGQFTFKDTTTREPPQNKPTFDGSKYPKPEDFFAAYERYKNALQEWQKQTGTVVTDSQNQPSRRPRREGLPGRKRGSYKHTFTDSYLADLEALEKENSIPCEENLEKTTDEHVPTVEREVDDSTVDTEKDLENVLANLLACSPDELEGDAGVRLLEERLNIKPIDKEMFTLPEFPDVKRMGLKASGRSKSNQRTALSNIQNLLKGNNSNATRRNSLLSTPNPPEDQFSFPDRDNILPGDLPSRDVDLAKDLNMCFRSSVANDADKVITSASPSNVGSPVFAASPFNGSVHKDSDEVDSGTQSGIHKSHSSLVRNADNCMDDSITKIHSGTIDVSIDVSMSQYKANRDTSRREKDDVNNEETTNLSDSVAEHPSSEAARMDPFTSEKDDIPYQQDETSKSPNRAPEQCNTMDGSYEHAEHIQGKHGEENENTDTSHAPQDVHDSLEKQTSKRRKRSGSGESNKKKRSKTVDDESEGDKQVKTVPHESGAKKQTKSKEGEKKKQKKTVTREGERFSRRKSLAAAGTKWESGVRRSTRIKSRPLEFWRGERFLLGRIHESLTTVIGIKYASPDKGRNENRVLKVKSFVSDDYKELINLAALH